MIFFIQFVSYCVVFVSVKDMLVLIVSLSVKCCTKFSKIHNEQIRTCVYVVCLNGKIYTESETEMASERTVKYLSYLDDEAKPPAPKANHLISI